MIPGKVLETQRVGMVKTLFSVVPQAEAETTE